MARRRIGEAEVIAAVRRASGITAARTARELFAFARANNLLLRKRHSAVSVRIGLGPGDRPATLFVLPEHDRFYTFWLDHWPPRYRSVVKRYAADLERIFPRLRVIAPQGTRMDIVQLSDVRTHMNAVERAVIAAIQGVRAINGERAGADSEVLAGLEGEKRRRMVIHRKREGRLRDARIAYVKNATGVLACEVTGCGFDFHFTYGEMGEDYAQVHHIRVLSDRSKPSNTRVADLRVVCANCHAMIHRGGKSRSLSQIATALRRARARRSRRRGITWS